MNLKTAKQIFWGGTISSLVIFLSLTFDTMTKLESRTNEKELTADVHAGKKIFRKYNCNDCHTILGIGGYYSHDLTRVYGRRGEQYIKQVILNPEETLKTSFRKMPKTYAGGKNVSEEEVDKLIAFFRWVNKIDTNKWPPQDHKEKAFGKRSGYHAARQSDLAVIKEHGCLQCHTFRNFGSSFATDLDDVSSKLQADEIDRILRKGKGNMPPLEGSDNIRAEIVRILSKKYGGHK